MLREGRRELRRLSLHDEKDGLDVKPGQRKRLYLLKGGLILGKAEGCARSTLELLLIDWSGGSVSLIRACPWACELNSNSYWSDQAGRQSDGFFANPLS